MARPPTRPQPPSRPVGQNPLYEEPFRTAGQRQTAASRYAERVAGPQSEIYEAEKRQQEGAANIGSAYTDLTGNLQKSLGAALGALGGATSGLSGANIQSGLASADVIRAGVPGLQGAALVSGTRNLISQKTREAIEARNEKRRQLYADRLNELYKRDVDKASAREQSALTRESLGSKEKIAGAELAQRQYEFAIKTDIDYKRLALDAKKLRQSGNDDAKAYLDKAAERMKALLNKQVKGSDATLGFTLRVYDPIKRDWVRKWYPGTESAAKDAARREFGPELTDADIQVQGSQTKNPSPDASYYSKYSTKQVRDAMIAWIASNVPGYNRQKAAAWVDAQPEMQLAG